MVTASFNRAKVFWTFGGWEQECVVTLLLLLLLLLCDV